MCEELFGDQLDEVVDIRGVHDWKKFMHGCRPSSADEDIQVQFSMQLRARADATIDVRSKAAVSSRVDWSNWFQIMPSPRVPATALPARDQVPELAPSKSWPEFKNKIVPCLQKFYSRAFKHPVHIPAEDQKEMLEFLRRGPPPASAPDWIKWSVTNGESETSDPADGAVQPEQPAAAAAAPAAVPPRVARKKKDWRPFLAPRSNATGKKCRCVFRTGCGVACTNENFLFHPHTHLHITRCGSTTHQKVTHRDCPLNHNNRTQDTQVDLDDGAGGDGAGGGAGTRAADSEDSEDSDDVVLSKIFPKAAKPFPYPVGTWVAVQFGDDYYSGQITKLYPGQDLCHVVFTDGDEADYEADEITYANQLYNQQFAPEEE